MLHYLLMLHLMSVFPFPFLAVGSFPFPFSLSFPCLIGKDLMEQIFGTRSSNTIAQDNFWYLSESTELEIVMYRHDMINVLVSFGFGLGQTWGLAIVVH
jgi:hypothetical protein